MKKNEKGLEREVKSEERTKDMTGELEHWTDRESVQSDRVNCQSWIRDGGTGLFVHSLRIRKRSQDTESFTVVVSRSASSVQ